jgi:hypothetical protein
MFAGAREFVRDAVGAETLRRNFGDICDTGNALPAAKLPERRVRPKGDGVGDPK